ncbi:MAG: hypothetical protein PVH88_27730 [Ignavibacteria bacterium]|jgi:hypothetical protein
MKLFIPIIFIISFLIFLSSCKDSSNSTNPLVSVKLSIEIISYEDISQEVDSSLYYMQMFVDWNATSSFHDTLKADSLARWFAEESEYEITDMWFPHAQSRCAYISSTDNIVIIKLSHPDNNIKEEGYIPTSYIANLCYAQYRHYIFTRE